MEKEFETNQVELTDEIIFENEKKIILTDEEINELTEDELVEYRQRLELAMDKCENEALVRGEEILPDEYYELKALEKKAIKAIKKLRKTEDKKGFFANLSLGSAIYGIVMIVLNIFPINPYLPLIILTATYEHLPEFLWKESGKDIFYTIYMVLMLVPGYVVWLFKKKDTNEEKFRKRNFLFVQIGITLVSIVAIVLYILWA